MCSNRTPLWLPLLLLLSLSGVVEARSIQPLDSIREAARQFLEQEGERLSGEVEVAVGRIDSRLRLARCDQPLSTEWPKGGRQSGTVSIRVACRGEVNWSIYVQGTIAVYDQVVVASRPLSRGSMLRPGDVELRREDMTRLNRGYFSSVDEVVGMEARRSLRAGMVLSPSQIEPPIVIRRGEKVSIRAQTGVVEVEMEGKALADGARGELIPVENLSSGQKIEAEVVGPGIVQVRL
ncbi:MAG: flagellar basal body P-ring formation chaperone FlgA [Pseudomonadota bacterium]